MSTKENQKEKPSGSAAAPAAPASANVNSFKDEFEKIYLENIRRDGADKLLKYLKDSDFFVAPASTKFHSNHANGLVKHSVMVYHRLAKLLEAEYGADWRKCPTASPGRGAVVSSDVPGEFLLGESAAVIALLHDVCKVGCYKTSERNVKVGTEWTKKPYFSFDDPLPYGHGEKSVYMISGFMRLSREEAMAINWHMGSYDSRSNYSNYTLSDAFQKFPLALLCHAADLIASYLDESIEKY